ncbi:MAG: RNA methyltransferase, partial [Clostridiales bacterium]|nr:RNA methyltransferase [Clostridiales bacterium]
ARESFLITEEISEKLYDKKSPQGVFCICKTLDKNLNIYKINYNGIYAAFEEIQTPGNLGAAARTAEALGLDGLIVSGGCDIYNPKAQRSAMGSLLRLDVIRTENLPEFLMKCSEKGMKTYAAVPDKNALPVTEIDKSGGLVAVIGNEGNGLTDETIKACSGRITIPMRGRAESLNAGAAASIIMWEMVR